MFPYWLLFAYFAAGALLHQDSLRRGERGKYPLLTIGALLITLMIGLRYRVGGDWFGYERMFSFAGGADLSQVIRLSDPGYEFLNWFVQQIGGKLWLVNLICAAIFASGLLAFARVQTAPWLTVLIAVPYLIIVVAMGYTRQGVAIGIVLAGIARLERGGTTLHFTLFIIAAAMFHKSVVFVLPLVLLSSPRNRLTNFVLIFSITFVLYDVFVSKSADLLITNYIEAEYASQGAAIRVAMSSVAAALFLFQQHRFGFGDRQSKIWRSFSIGTFVLAILLFALPSSTVVDRLALYTIPLQLAVISRAPLAYRSPGFGLFLVILYCFAVQWVWLNYAANSSTWIPYRIYPLS